MREGQPTQDQIDACAALATHPELDRNARWAVLSVQAEAHVARGEYDKAMAIHEEIGNEHIGAAILYGRAEAKYALGDTHGARLDAQRGMTEDPRLRSEYERHVRERESDVLDPPFLGTSALDRARATLDITLGVIQDGFPDTVDIRQRQKVLAFMGYYDGPVDGVDSPALRRAVMACIEAICWDRFLSSM